jgi:GntR family transcriptional regulator
MTARQALKSLCSLGVAHSQRGKGTFVSEIKLEKNIREVQSFSEEMEARGSRPHSRLISSEVVPAESEAGEALHLSPEEKVIRIRRVRVADVVPMGVETTCLPQSLCPDLLDSFAPRTSLYRTLLQVYGIHIVQADRWLRRVLPTRKKRDCWVFRKEARCFCLRAPLTWKAERRWST